MENSSQQEIFNFIPERRQHKLSILSAKQDNSIVLNLTGIVAKDMETLFVSSNARAQHSES